MIRQKIVKLHYNIIIFLTNTLIRHTVFPDEGEVCVFF